jgi:hypothetical protein
VVDVVVDLASNDDDVIWFCYCMRAAVVAVGVKWRWCFAINCDRPENWTYIQTRATDTTQLQYR